MRILVTNDDGIHSPGLDTCEEIAHALSDDVWVIAPEHDQSGVAHSLSLNDPLRLRQVAERRFAVRGTPTDCVTMGAMGRIACISMSARTDAAILIIGSPTGGMGLRRPRTVPTSRRWKSTAF